MGLYLEAESHSHGSNVAAAKVPVAILEVILLIDELATGLPQGSQISSSSVVLLFEFTIWSGLLLIFNNVAVTDAVSHIIL